MKNIGKPVRWLMFNCGILATLYVGVIVGHDGFKNILLFVLWALIVLSFFSLTEGTRKSIQQAGRSVPGWLDCLVESSIIFTLVYNGWIITGTFYLIKAALISAAYSAGNKTD